jgi:hypothetical protein
MRNSVYNWVREDYWGCGELKDWLLNEIDWMGTASIFRWSDDWVQAQTI